MRIDIPVKDKQKKSLPSYRLAPPK